MSAAEKEPAKIPGRQVLLLSLLVLAGFAVFYGGLAQLPKRYLYSGEVAEKTPAPVTTSGTADPAAAPAWLQDPLAVCAECHTPTDADRFRKIIVPLLAAAAAGYGAGAMPNPEMSHAPPPAPGTGGTTAPAPNATLAESK